jgi:hypothetical protein
MAELPLMAQLVFWTSVIALVPFLPCIVWAWIRVRQAPPMTGGSPREQIRSGAEPFVAAPAPEETEAWRDEQEVFDARGRLIGYLRVEREYQAA